ncbi:hypothetical protein PCASD_18100, partial [Puccinia coronata f. sp. avenae]
MEDRAVQLFFILQSIIQIGNQNAGAEAVRTVVRLKSNNKTTKIAWQVIYSDRTRLVQMTAECMYL